MRRLTELAVVAVCLAVAGQVLAGCSGTPSAAPATAASATPRPSRTPNPHASNTHDVCTAINQLLADGAARFGSDVGTMVGHLAGSNPADADKFKASALAGLGDLAGKVRAAGQQATDPELVTAVNTVADNLDRLAADPTLLDGVRTKADIPAVNKKVTSAASPLTGICAR
jgi:hypothetical protein